MVKYRVKFILVKFIGKFSTRRARFNEKAHYCANKFLCVFVWKARRENYLSGVLIFQPLSGLLFVYSVGISAYWFYIVEWCSRGSYRVPSRFYYTPSPRLVYYVLYYLNENFLKWRIFFSSILPVCQWIGWFSSRFERNVMQIFSNESRSAWVNDYASQIRSAS